MYQVVLFVLMLMNVVSVKTENICTVDCDCIPDTECNYNGWIIRCLNNFTEIDEIPHVYGHSMCSHYPRMVIADSNIPIISSNTFARNRDLKILDMIHNHIRAFGLDAFHDMNDLETLIISNNEVSTIRRGSFNSLQRLQTLRLDENKITEIESDAFTGCSRLTEVHLENNNISELSKNLFDGLSKLSYFNVSGNSLKRFLLFKKVQIMSLDLSNNHIRELDDWQFSWIRNLFVSNNNFQEMIEIRSENVQLLLDHNNITSLKSSASNQTKYDLTVLDLSYNSIGFISRDYLHHLSNLKKLNLQHNKIDKIDIDFFKSLSQLTYLDLSSNQIANFQRGTFAGPHNLQILNISNNRLVEMHFDPSFGNLQRFYFDNNRISSLDVAAIHQQSKHLREISLNNNRQWNCKELMQMCFQLQNFGVTVLKGNSFNVENVYGIPCKEEQSNENPKNTASVSNQDATDQEKNAVSLTPISEEKDQTILTLILVVLIGMFCCLAILIYLKLQKYRNRTNQTTGVDNLNAISQIELCEQ